MTDATTEEAAEDESGGIGVITAIEHTDGTMIDVGDITADIRSEWIDHITTQLESIDGIKEVYGAGNTFMNNQGGQFEIVVQHSAPNYGDGVNLDCNIRSVAQNIRYTLEDIHQLSQYDIVLRPEKMNSRTDRYTDAVYVIEFDLV